MALRRREGAMSARPPAAADRAGHRRDGGMDPRGRAAMRTLAGRARTSTAAESDPEAAHAATAAAVLRGSQRQTWDRVAASIGDLSGAPSTAYYRRCEIALLDRSFGDLRGKRILKLDLWNEAFNTRILHWMRDQGAEAYGLDVSRVVVARARRNTRALGQPARLVRA